MQEVLLILFFVSHPIINEVMANPRGRELSSGDKNEFVEIYNPDSIPLNLSNFMLSDGDEIDTIVPFADSSILYLYPGVFINQDSIPSGCYGIVIDREYLDSSDVSQPYNFPDGAVIFTTNDNDIGNGLSNNDPIYLISFDWDTVDTYGTPANPVDSIPVVPPDGISVERINPLEPDRADNWGLSRDPGGSTPGRQNSLTRWFDIGIISFNHGEGGIGESMSVSLCIENFGIYSVDSFTLGVISNFFDTTFTVFHHFEWRDTVDMNFVTPEITGQFVVMKVFVSLERDEDPANDTVMALIPVNLPPVVINEVMYKDTVEWVEIYNNTENSLNLESFRLKDASTHFSDFFPYAILDAHGYLVITGDSTLLKARFPDVRNFIQVANFPTLNNNYDDVILYDAGGEVVDSLHYSSKWGGGERVSLERVSPLIATNLKENWGSSRSPTGGTPGAPNSLSRFKVRSKMMQLPSKILRPSQGNFVIKLNVKPSDRVILYIFDLRGRLVRKLIDGERGVYIASWDGRNRWGDIVTKGLYILYCATDERREKAVIMVK